MSARRVTRPSRRDLSMLFQGNRSRSASSLLSRPTNPCPKTLCTLLFVIFHRVKRIEMWRTHVREEEWIRNGGASYRAWMNKGKIAIFYLYITYITWMKNHGESLRSFFVRKFHPFCILWKSIIVVSTKVDAVAAMF